MYPSKLILLSLYIAFDKHQSDNEMNNQYFNKFFV
jgi:hypothetical protein